MDKVKQKQITESILNRNLNEQVHALIREFSMACKKAAVYGANHPSSKRAVHKPFLLLDEIFRFKKFSIKPSREIHDSTVMYQANHPNSI